MKRNTTTQSRRRFLQTTAVATASFSIIPNLLKAAPNDRLNVACIGVGGRGVANVQGVRGENIVALCDVDERQAGGMFGEFPKARRFVDFRRMLDAMDKEIDAVVVATPDHTHSAACLDAIRRGKHIYSEKPLCHSIYEVRQLRQAVHEHQVISQLGNQGHSFDHIRVFCEWIWDGAIGNVTEVQAFCGSNYSRIAQLDRLKETYEVPAELNWDLWQGPIPERPYNPAYIRGRWRGWQAYGSGVIGDWVCHVVDPVFWALDLDAPQTIQAEPVNYDPKLHAETFPPATKITYEFAAKGKRGPVKLTWYDGEAKPPRPRELEEGRKVPDIGAFVIGDAGKMMYGSHGAGGVRIIPEEKMKTYQRPEPTIPRVKDHHQDWLDAIKNGRQAGSHFDYGGPLTEIALLGIIAMKFPGEKLAWDADHLRFGFNDANACIRPPFRDGWKI